MRRAFKWIGVGFSLLIVVAWITSLFVEGQLLVSSRAIAKIEAGGILFIASDIDFAQVYGGANVIKSELAWRRADNLGFGKPWAIAYWPINPHNIGSTDKLTMIVVSFWFPLICFVLLTMWLWWRDRPRGRLGCCLRCGYDLTGNISGVCSECGLAKPPAVTR